MNESHTLGRVQRTLVLSCGELSDQCGTLFAEMLAERGGPTAATAVVSLNGSKTDWETALAAALDRISPPDLAARLAQAGWQLAQTPLLHLILLLTAEAGGGKRAANLVETAANQIYHQLGIEPLVFPIWLVRDGQEVAPANHLVTTHPLPLGNLVLGLCNQDGLRLPDGASLCAVTAELLWCFTTTPLIAFLEQHQTDLPYLDGPSFLTAGVHVWTWFPEDAMRQFTRWWLHNVIERWLSDSVAEDSLVTVPGWLQTQQLTPQQFATHALREQEAALPQLPEAEWQIPWPWTLSTLFEKSRFENRIDEEATRAYAKQAQLRLYDPLLRAGDILHEQAYQLLNSQPIAGVAQTLAWLHAVATACEDQLPSLFDWENSLDEMADTWAVARGELEAQIQDALSHFPNTPQAWLRLLWRPWRWPGKLLTYWRLQKAGQQLCQIYTRQAALRRQKIEQQTAYQGVIELRQVVQRLGSQVAEIREMLHARLGLLPDEPATDAEACPFPLAPLSVPESFYDPLVPDGAAEAAFAAAAVGGLGSQIRQLDDILFDRLLEVAAERLESLMQLTPADLLLDQITSAGQAAPPTLLAGWAAACPLWPVDAASLDEVRRQNQATPAVLCGANALQLSDQFSEMTDTIFSLPTGWTRHLWLVRLHLGLPPATATAAIARQEEKTHE